MIFEVASTLLLTPFIIRTLGQAEYGVYTLSAAITAYLLLLDLGIGNAVTRYIAKYRVENDKAKAESFLGVATIYYLAIAAITLGIGVLLVKLFPSVFAVGLNKQEILLGQELLSITIINATVTLGSAAYFNTIIAYEKFKISKGASIAQIIFRMVLIYIALRAGMGSVGIVSANLTLTILLRSFFILYVLFKLKLRPSLHGINFPFIKEIIAYSSLILLQMVATQINGTIGQILIGTLIVSASGILAIYGVGIQIIQYFQSIGVAFTGVLMPGIVRLVENNATPEAITSEMIRIGRIIFMVLAIIFGGFLVCGQDFIILWAGKANKSAYFVDLILMFSYIFMLTESVGTQILWAMNAHKEQSIMKILAVLFNICATIFFIKMNPLLGAAIGTSLSVLIGDVLVMNYIFVKKIQINLWKYYCGLFKGILVSLFCTIILGLLIRQYTTLGWGNLLINISSMCAIYGILLYKIGMNSYEKNLAFGGLKRLIKK